MIFTKVYPIIAATLVSAVLSGQSWRGTIGGLVTGSDGKPVSNASVILVHAETGRQRTVKSDAHGEFTVASLPPGEYRLEVERDGFRKHIQTISLLVNHELRVDVPLLPGRLTEEVTVRGTHELLKTDSASVSTVLENRKITQLPLNGRNFYELSLLAPGVLPAAPGSAGSVRGDFAIHVNGAREDANYFVLDGVYNSDPKLNGIAVTPSVDAVREFEILTNSYDASFGRNAGGQVNVVLKSGTNDLHGTAYEFFRNAALDARNAFAPRTEPKPQYQRNQFGFSLGGPVARNRTFFFGDYEGRRSREGITRISNVPTALERQGDFSQSARPPIDLFTQQPFPDNRIPAQRIHPTDLAIANLYPLPNRDVPGANFVSSPSQRDQADNFDVRLDHSISPSSEFAVRYSFSDRELYEPFTGPSFALVPGFGADTQRRAQNVMVSETHVFTPVLLNELRAGYNRVASGTFQQNINRNLNQEVGLPAVSSNPRDYGLSTITLPGFSPIGDERNNPQHSVTNTYQLIDQLSYTRGRHFLKTGFDFRFLRQNGFRDVASRGFLTFFGITGNPLGDLLQGFPTLTGVATLDNHQHLRTESYNFFVQDTFRITPKLVLTAGLRYEFNSPPVDVRDRANVYDVATGRLVPVGTAGTPRSGFFADKNNFAPRIGIAWSPGARNTVVRAGYGVYYDQSAFAPGEGLYFNAPYFDFKLFQFQPQAPLTLFNPFPLNQALPIGPSALSFQRDLKTPYVQQWNFNIQRQLGTNRLGEIGYVGSKGTKLISMRDLNQPRPSTQIPNLRPNPLFDDITILESRSNSNYHSLQAKYQQRITAGLGVLTSYTWGKSIDDASNAFASAGDPNFPQDSHNVRAERARSGFDIKHRLACSYTWDLPLGPGPILGGWQTNGVWTFQTGRPFTAALHPDLDNSNTGRSILGFGANDRPNVVGDPKLSNPTPDRWFNTEAFSVPPFGTFGNAGRNILDGPGYQSIDVSLVKNTPVTEGTLIQFRAEAFNVFNRANFDLPDIFVGSPTFGRILSAQSPRHIQLGLKFIF